MTVESRGRSCGSPRANWREQPIASGKSQDRYSTEVVTNRSRRPLTKPEGEQLVKQARNDPQILRAAGSIRRAATAIITARRSPIAPLAQALRLSWRPKVSEGFSCERRAFTISPLTSNTYRTSARTAANRYTSNPTENPSFPLFANRFEQGIYILDEPEAALSPQRQLSFLKIIHDLATPGHFRILEKGRCVAAGNIDELSDEVVRAHLSV